MNSYSYRIHAARQARIRARAVHHSIAAEAWARAHRVAQRVGDRLAKRAVILARQLHRAPTEHELMLELIYMLNHGE